jgi:hypothetical protein
VGRLEVGGRKEWGKEEGPKESNTLISPRGGHRKSLDYHSTLLLNHKNIEILCKFPLFIPLLFLLRGIHNVP